VNAARKGSSLPFHRAIRKYGASAFTCEVLHAGLSLTDALSAEKAAIARLCAAGDGGYNATTGGEGYEYGAEAREKISASLKGRKVSDETRSRMRAAAKLRMTPEARAHLSRVWCQRGGAPRNPSPSPKSAASKAKQRAWWTPERRAEMADKMRKIRAERRCA
jgi:hypothetical protein